MFVSELWNHGARLMRVNLRYLNFYGLIFLLEISERSTYQRLKMHWVNGKFAGTDKNARLIRDIETSEFETTRFDSTIKLTFQQ